MATTRRLSKSMPASSVESKPEPEPTVYFMASMTVLPVTNISPSTASRRRFSAFLAVGAKCSAASLPTRQRFISSGKGLYLSYVRSPAST